jgi:hypothetical protein
VVTDDDGTCPEDFNGNDPKNIVNCLGTNGVQIEQSRDARKIYGMQIAEAVANIIGPKVKVCTVLVFEASRGLACLMKNAGYSVLVMSRTGISSIPCELRRLLFRIRHYHRGNADPCIEP